MPFPQKHGRGTSWGLRIGRFAYSTDTDGLDEQAFDTLQGIEVWIVDALRDSPAPQPRPSRAGAALDRSASSRREAYLTHMNHEVDYADWAARLPNGVLPAHDGLVLEIED